MMRRLKPLPLAFAAGVRRSVLSMPGLAHADDTLNDNTQSVVANRIAFER